MIISRMRWAGRVARRGDRRGAFLRERDHLEDPDVDGRMILKWFFKKMVGRHGLDCSGSREGQVAGACECGNERSGSIKCGVFLE
jgi:hypothetical protein